MYNLSVLAFSGSTADLFSPKKRHKKCKNIFFSFFFRNSFCFGFQFIFMDPKANSRTTNLKISRIFCLVQFVTLKFCSNWSQFFLQFRFVVSELVVGFGEQEKVKIFRESHNFIKKNFGYDRLEYLLQFQIGADWYVYCLCQLLGHFSIKTIKN